MGQAFGCIQVDESTVAVKEKCGKFDRELEPGCHCLPWCLCHRVTGKVSLRVEQLDFRCEAKTKDNAFVAVVACIQYGVMKGKAKDALYNLSDAKGKIQAKGQIQPNVFDAIRVSVSKRNWDSAFEEKDYIANELKDELEKAMSGYGIKIVKTFILDIEPDSNMKKAMNEIHEGAIKNAANKKAEAEKTLQNKPAKANAEAEKTSQNKPTEGEPKAEKIKDEAETEEISQSKRAEGEPEEGEISQSKRAEGKPEGEEISQSKLAEGEPEEEEISQSKRAEGKPQEEEISQSKLAEGEAEEEEISQSKRAEGKDEEEEILAKGEAGLLGPGIAGQYSVLASSENGPGTFA